MATAAKKSTTKRAAREPGNEETAGRKILRSIMEGRGCHLDAAETQIVAGVLGIKVPSVSLGVGPQTSGSTAATDEG